MAMPVSQILSMSYAKVLNEKRKPENLWAENAAMAMFDSRGFIQKIDFGATLDVNVDYRRNPGADFQETDMDEDSTTKTDVFSSASYSIAQLNAPITWTKLDEAKNPTDTQRFALTANLIENALVTHDSLIEEYIFGTSYKGFLGLGTLVPTNGQGTVGAIDASTETVWRNPATLYTNATDIEASLTTNWNAVAKGSGGMTPQILLSGSVPHAQFESTQQALQRWSDGKKADAGFKVLAFKGADYFFSQYGGTRVYLLNNKAFSLKVSKQYFRDRGETMELERINGFKSRIYTALQSVVANKARLGVVYISGQ